MDEEMLTMDQKVECLQLVPEGDCTARSFIKTSPSLVSGLVRTEDDTDQKNRRGNIDKTSPRYDSGDIVKQANQVNTCEAITGVVISRQDDELIGHASNPTPVGCEKAITIDIPGEECKQSDLGYGRHMFSGGSRLPESICAPILQATCDSDNSAENGSKCSDTSVDMAANSALVEKHEQLDGDESSKSSDGFWLNRRDKVFDRNVPGNVEESDNDDTSSSGSKLGLSQRDLDSLIGQHISYRSDTLSRKSKDTSILDSILEYSERSDEDHANSLQIEDDCEPTTEEELQIDDAKSTGLCRDTGFPSEDEQSDEDDVLQIDEAISTGVRRDADLSGDDDCEQSAKDGGLQIDEAKSTEIRRDTDLSGKDDCELSAKDGGLQIDEAKSIEICSDIDLPGEEDCGLFAKDERSQKDEAISTEIRRDTDLSGKDDCELSAKDGELQIDKAKSIEILSDIDLSGEDDCEQSDEDGGLQIDEPISTDSDLSGEDDCEQSDEDGVLPKDEEVSSEISLGTYLPSTILVDVCEQSDADGVFKRDDVISTRLSRDIDLSSKVLADDNNQCEGDYDFKGDETMSSGLNIYADLTSGTLADDCNQCEEENVFKREAISTGLNRDAGFTNGILADGFRESDEDGVIKRDQTNSTQSSIDADITGENQAQNVHLSKNDITSRRPIFGNNIGLDLDVQIKTPVEDCEQLGGENNTGRDSKLSSQTVVLDSTQAVAYSTDMSSEVPDIPISKEIKHKPTATTFDEEDVARKNDENNEPSTEDAKGLLCRKVAGGRKLGAVSSIINKYNTLLHSAVPPNEKEKFKPKTIKLATSKDKNGCTDSAKHDPGTASQNVINDDVALDDVNMTCDNENDEQIISQRDEIVGVDSKTEVESYCNIQNHHDKRTNKSEEHGATTIHSEQEMRGSCDTNENYEDSLAVATCDEIQEPDLTSEQAVDQTEKLNIDKVNLHANYIHDQPRETVVEETRETNFTESLSKCNSSRLESPFGSIDADDEFSSLEDYKSATPTSPKSLNSEYENRSFYQTGVISVNEIQTVWQVDKVKVDEDLEELPVKNESDIESCEQHNNDNGNQNIMIPDLHSVETTILINHETVLLSVEKPEVNDSDVFNETSSRNIFHNSLQDIDPSLTESPTCDLNPEPIDMEDSELIYEDAESGDLKAQSESSWGQVLSCYDSTGIQSDSEMQECIQLYANKDMRSRESSIYDDVASGSNLDFSTAVNNPDATHLKYVSSYQSDNGSCSNFYSEEGDNIQSDNQDGYASALDHAGDLDVLSSNGCCEPLELGSESYNSSEEENDCNIKMPVNVDHTHYRGEWNKLCDEKLTKLLFPLEEENVSDCKKTESSIENADLDQMNYTNTSFQRGEENDQQCITGVYTDECISQDDRDGEECMSYSETSLSCTQQQETGTEPNNSVLYYEDIVKTTTKKETLTNEGFDCLTMRGDCKDDEVGVIEDTHLKDLIEELNSTQDDSTKEDHPHNENALVEKCDNRAIDEDAPSIKQNDVKSESLTTLSDGDESCSEELKSMPVVIGNNEPINQDSPHVTDEGGNDEEDNSEALSGDEEDAETKDACCKEYQVVLKRMKKLKETMDKLTEQVSRERTYLQEESAMYMSLPKCNLTLFEHKLMEVQRERWLESQRVKISREEYARRLQEADQMCVNEIQQMDAAEEKLRHLSRITDVWTRTNVVFPYYDLPSLDLAQPEEETPEVTREKVDELETQVVDLIGPSDVYMTSWLLNEAENVKVNYSVVGNKTANIQNLNDLSVDQMLLPPHLLEKLEEMRDLVKANSLTTGFSQNANGNNNLNNLQINVPESRDSPLTFPTKLQGTNHPGT